MKAMFHWARKNEVVEKIPNIDAVSKVQVVKRRRPTFTSEQITILLENSDAQMRAMIALALSGQILISKEKGCG